MFYLLERVWVGMMFLKSSWSALSWPDLSKLSSRRQGGSVTNFLFALTCIQQLISTLWSFSRKFLFFYVTLRYQSIISSTPPFLLTKEGRKVVTHTHTHTHPPLFLCSMLNCLTCLIFAMETKMQITIKLWCLAEVWYLLELPKIGELLKAVDCIWFWCFLMTVFYWSKQAAETGRN